MQTVSALPYINFAITGSLSGNSTVTDKIILNWTENLTAVQKNDFGVGNNSKSFNILSASTKGNIVTLTLNYSLKTNETLTVYYNSTWYGGVKNSSGDKALDQNITPMDGISPIMDSCLASDFRTLVLIFSELLDNSSFNISDFSTKYNITSLNASGNSVTLFLEDDIEINNTNITITGSVSDTSGNLLSSGTINCTVNDTISPEIEITATNLARPGQNMTIIIYANESFLNKTSVSVVIKNETETITEVPLKENNSVFSGNWNATNNGTFYIFAFASDMFGNSVNRTKAFVVSEKADSVFANDSIRLVENQSSFLDAKNSTNTTLNISVKENLTSYLTVLKYDQNPLENISGLNGLKYIEIETNNETSNNLSWVLIRIYYTDAEISGIDESGIKIYFYNETFWEEMNTIVNETANYVETNSTHLSFFGVFGNLATYCGDGSCNNGEGCSSCSTDCGACSSGGGTVFLRIENKTKNITENKTKNITENLTELICYPTSRVCLENDLMMCYEGTDWIKEKTCEYRCSEDVCIEEEPRQVPVIMPINTTLNITDTPIDMTGEIIKIAENPVISSSIIILIVAIFLFFGFRIKFR